MQNLYKVAVVGATGLVGTTLLSILEERQFPIEKLYVLASKRSTGEILEFKKKSYAVEDLANFDFSLTQICFFCAGNEVSAEFAPKAAAAGNIVIDKSSYFRYDLDVPLIIPEVNPEAIGNYRHKNIIANPNCNVIPIVMAIKPIYEAVGINRINIATYQSVSGSGKEAIKELKDQTIEILNGRPIKSNVYPQQIAFNVLPQIDDFQNNGYTKEEMKLVWEIQKIFSDTSISINPTTVRVPVLLGHSAAVHLETREKISTARAIELISKMEGVTVLSNNQYPTPAVNAAGQDQVFVGRIREDISHQNGLNLWVVTDNIRKGAALNAIQVVEKLINSPVQRRYKPCKI